MFGGDGQALPHHLPHHHRHNNLSTARSAPSIKMPTRPLPQTGSHLASLRVSQAPLPLRVSPAQTEHHRRSLLVVEAAALPLISPQGPLQQQAIHLLP